MARGRKQAKTAEARESAIVAKAFDLAEKQIDDGTVSAQVLTHYLKLGTEREKLERERLKQQTEVEKAKAASMASSQKSEEMYAEAIAAFQAYQGMSVEEIDDN